MYDMYIFTYTMEWEEISRLIQCISSEAFLLLPLFY
jgi:hypothetical protein